MWWVFFYSAAVNSRQERYIFSVLANIWFSIRFSPSRVKNTSAQSITALLKAIRYRVGWAVNNKEIKK